MSGKRGGTGVRSLKPRLHKARRKAGSNRWLQRQLSDTFVHQARAAGYRSRAAFKLIELDDRFSLFRRDQRVVDLGAAPGSWSQVAVERATAGQVVALDLLETEPLEGVTVLQGDLNDEDTPARLSTALGGPADLVLSDLAMPTTGHRATDHLRTMALAESAADVATQLLAPGGALVLKFFQGADEAQLFDELRKMFERVQRVKPAASRSDSVELYMVARGFRGLSPLLE